MSSSNHSPSNPPPSRRDFIKIAAASLGGTFLVGAGVGCGGSADIFGGGGGLGGPVGTAQLPNGYAFYRVVTAKDSNIPDVSEMLGGVLSNDSTILFYGLFNDTHHGIFQVDIDYDGSNAPRLTDQPTVLIREGMNLGRIVVDKIGSAALSNNGPFSTCAAVVTAAAGSEQKLVGTPSIWQNNGGDRFEALATHLDATPVGGWYGAHMSDVAINKNGDVLMVSEYHQMTANGPKLAQGLFKLDGGVSPSTGSLIAETGQTPQGANGTIAQFGLVDFDDEGNYVAQYFMGGGTGRANGDVVSGVLGGRAGGRAVHIGGGATRDGLSARTFYGPRVQGGNYSLMQHSGGANDHLDLYFNSTHVTSTGSRTSTNKTIRGMGPASVSGGLIHFLASVDHGMELIVSNGKEQKTILSYNDTVRNSDKKIVAIVHGFHTDQADSAGRIVFIGDFEDGSQSVVVGIPI